MMNQRIGLLPLILTSTIIILAAFTAGYFFGNNATSFRSNGTVASAASTTQPTEEATSSAAFWNNTLDSLLSFTEDSSEPVSELDLDPFWTVWHEINDKYVTSEMPSDEKKVYGAIAGLVSSLDDPYSVFLPPVESKMFEEDVSGNFEGVGMEVGIRDSMLTVIAPLKNTPADNAGILAGDIILQIDNEVTLDMSLNDAVSIIRGPKGSTVTLTIIREGEDEPLEIGVVRDTITIPVIHSEARDDGIFVIELYSFTATSPQLFQNALREFIESGYNKLLIDLRSNPGGYLNAAVELGSWFLPAGKVVAREAYGPNKEETIYRSRGYNVFSDKLKLAILIDHGTASASEILAGALSEHDIATLIGTQSFGKGSVQELIRITPETSLKLTIARWLTPEGVSISEEGLTPDIEVAITREDIEEGIDPQFEAAVQFLQSIHDKPIITNNENETEHESDTTQ